MSVIAGQYPDTFSYHFGRFAIGPRTRVANGLRECDQATSARFVTYWKKSFSLAHRQLLRQYVATTVATKMGVQS